LKDEMEMNMRLIGCSSVDQLNPTLVDTRGLSTHNTTVPADSLGLSVYDPLISPKEKLSRDAHAGKVMRDAIGLVKSILDKELTPNGLTTAEIFKLTQQRTPPPDFKPVPLPCPPNPDSIIRSTTYLKKCILPILEGSGLIRMSFQRRTTDPKETWVWVSDQRIHPVQRGNIVPEVSTNENPRLTHLKYFKRKRIYRAMSRYQAFQEAMQKSKDS